MAQIPSVDDSVLKKTGPEIFKELLRVYATAEVEDYFKGGIWHDYLIKADLQLIVAHRAEAGAPDPPSIENVKVEQPLPQGPSQAALPSTVRPALLGMTAGTVVRPPGAGLVLPAGVAPPDRSLAAGAAVNLAELRLLALFVAKWKLDPTKSKILMAKLTPVRRRLVIQNFKTAATGDAATTALEQFIQQGENMQGWGAGPVTTSATWGSGVAKPGGVTVTPRAVAPRPAVTAAGVAVGVKRPLMPVNVAFDPMKRPRLATPTLARPAGAVRPAMRPAVAGGGMVRPAVAPKAKAGAPGAFLKNLLAMF